RPPPRSTLFPYTTLFRSAQFGSGLQRRHEAIGRQEREVSDTDHPHPRVAIDRAEGVELLDIGLGHMRLVAQDTMRRVVQALVHADRKSTRLNSSHVEISY